MFDMFDKARVDSGAWSGVGVRIVILLDQARINPLVYKAVEKFRVIVGLQTLKKTFDCRDLELNDVLLVAGPANTISVNSDLRR